MIINLKDFSILFHNKINIKDYDKVSIIGSGKSLGNINLEVLNLEKKNFIICINYSIFYQNIKPHMHFTLDETFIEKIYYKHPNKYPLDKIKKNKRLIKILFPDNINSKKSIPKDIILINHYSGYNLKKLKEFGHRVPSNYLSGNKAIYLALYLGFKNIKLYGFDSLDPTINLPLVYEKKNIHIDDYHKNKKKYNDVIFKNNIIDNNINKFFKLVERQKKSKNIKSDIKITFKNNFRLLKLNKFYTLFHKKFKINNFENVCIIGSGYSLKKIKNNLKINNKSFIICINYSIFYRNLKCHLHYTNNQKFFKKIYEDPDKFNMNKLNNVMKVIFPNEFNSELFDNSTYTILNNCDYNFNNLNELHKKVPLNDLSGNKAIYLAIFLGFRNINLYGFDSINPNIKNPNIYEKEEIHCDPYHFDKKKYNDVILKLESNGNNMKKFLELVNKQEVINKNHNLKFDFYKNIFTSKNILLSYLIYKKIFKGGKLNIQNNKNNNKKDIIKINFK